MSKYKKYINGGAINPFWIREQEERNNDNSNCTTVNITTSTRRYNYSLEEKFNFVKNHSDSPENLKLAKQIIGII